MLIRDAGSLRTGVVRIAGCSYIPPAPNIDVVYEDLKKIDNISSAINKALVMFCYLTRSQLFRDGNKRIAQLMTNKILIENGIGILNFKIELIPKLLMHLTEYYDSDDSYKLCKFLYDNCIDFIE